MKTLIISIAAQNIHKTLAPFCLKAYAEQCGYDIDILETDANVAPQLICQSAMQYDFDVLAFSCYIFNIDVVAKVATMLKAMYPSVPIILGGPEVWFVQDLSEYPYANFVIKGAGELAFVQALEQIKQGKDAKILQKGCNFCDMPSPYTDYFFDSLKKDVLPIQSKLIYYEGSRGCPYKCAYCISSTFCGVQFLPLDRVFYDIDKLLQHGVKCLKFVDRTFNCDKQRAYKIWSYVSQLHTDCVFHFEVAPDLFDNDLFEVLEQAPKNRIQLEVGIQSTNAATLQAIDRAMDVKLALKNIARLSSIEGIKVFVDLIAGLPHESMDTFLQGVEDCLQCQPHVLEIGFLKMLKGTKIRQEQYALFMDNAPYEVYKTDTLSLNDMLTIKKLGYIIDKFYNSHAMQNSLSFAMLHMQPTDFFCMLASLAPLQKLSQKSAFELLYSVLKRFDAGYAHDYIKLDCLSHNFKAVLPEGIHQNRDHAQEKLQKNLRKNAQNIRVEYFEHLNKYFLFDYDQKNTKNNTYIFEELNPATKK